MATKIQLSTNDEIQAPPVETTDQREPAAAGAAAPGTSPETPEQKPINWPTFLRTASQQAIKERLSEEISDILKQQGLEHDCCLAILEPRDSIDSFDLDQIF